MTSILPKSLSLGQGGSQNPEELMAKACVDHAVKNAYPGMVNAVQNLCGWPIEELIDAVYPDAQLVVKIAIKRRILLTEMGRMAASNVSVGNGGNSRIQVSVGSGGGGASWHGHSLPQGAAPSGFSLRDMLCMRMRWREWAEGFQHVDVHDAGETVHIWLITKDGQSLVLQDSGAMFPSDALVGKIQLVKSPT